MLRAFFKKWKSGILLFTLFVLVSFFVFNSENTEYYEYEEGLAMVEQIEIPKHIKTPQNVRGLYMTSWVAGSPNIRKDLIAFADESEINSVIIDIKDDTGKISFLIDNEKIAKLNWSENRIGDIRELIDDLHSRDIYVIGRVSVFQDPYFARQRPDLAVQSKYGGVWRDRKGLSFVDPGAREYWDYIIQIAKESEDVGFDEINFDYIRYPTDGDLSAMVFPYAGRGEKAVVLEEFFNYLNSELADLSIPISADLFGLTTWAEDDLNIGQVLERAAPYFDFIAPMVYPSHYAPGFQEMKNPAHYPYEVVHTAMVFASFRLEQIGQDPKKLRPWIQDFDLGGEYGEREVRLQQQAVYDAGLTSWMSWDASNKYTKEAY